MTTTKHMAPEIIVRLMVYFLY